MSMLHKQSKYAEFFLRNDRLFVPFNDSFLLNMFIRLGKDRLHLFELHNLQQRFLVISKSPYNSKSELRVLSYIAQGSTLSLGRSDSFQFGPTVSRSHISLSHRQAYVVIEDLNSTNGTWVFAPADSVLVSGNQPFVGFPRRGLVELLLR